MNSGLVALQRKDLNDFVAREYLYALKKNNIDLQRLACQAILTVFEKDKDFVEGATHYEHTKIYGTPKWARFMRAVKVIYRGTRNEITFYKKR
jgi:hypothetical protein